MSVSICAKNVWNRVYDLTHHIYCVCVCGRRGMCDAYQMIACKWISHWCVIRCSFIDHYMLNNWIWMLPLNCGNRIISSHHHWHIVSFTIFCSRSFSASIPHIHFVNLWFLFRFTFALYWSKIIHLKTSKYLERKHNSQNKHNSNKSGQKRQKEVCFWNIFCNFSPFHLFFWI